MTAGQEIFAIIGLVLVSLVFSNCVTGYLLYHHGRQKGMREPLGEREKVLRADLRKATDALSESRPVRNRIRMSRERRTRNPG